MKETNIKRIGEINTNNQGLKMEIINYRKYTDIDIKFEDGYISYNKEYKSFKNGSIKNPNNKDCQINNRMGELNHNSNGTLMKIIEYNRNDNIIIEFQDEYKYKTKADYKNFKKGNILNPYDRTVYNIGYLGEGKYRTKINNKRTIIYIYWIGMFNRCYNEMNLQKEPAYKGCEVCEEWHNFQSFAKWFDENYYNIDGEEMNLDKDILFKGNKIYSPKSCIFVPKRINNLFTKSDRTRGEYPIGVTFNKKNNNYMSRCNVIENNKTKSVYLGSFKDTMSAFNKYKKYKEKYIKEVADLYKDRIPKILYDAMYSYKVDIAD